MLGRELKGRYRIIKELGAGGFGQTYLAEDTHRPGLPYCVVKQLMPISKDTEFLQIARRLFNMEAEILEKLGSHPQIPQLLAYFEEDKEFYLVEEFIRGHALRDLLVVGKSFPEFEVINLLKDVLSVLAFIHEKGIIHRDIKPSNIIRRKQDERFILIDFGAVKQIQPHVLREQGNVALTTLTIAIGTTDYAPLEQLAGQPRFNSDIYSLGIVAIQALTGVLPSQLKRDFHTGMIVWQHLCPVREDLAAIISRMTHPTFTQRYQSATAVLQDIEELESTKVGNQPIINASTTVPTLASNSEPQNISSQVVLSSEQQAQLEEILREFVGIIAPILLQEDLAQVSSGEELVEKLTLHLPRNQQPEFRRKAKTIVQKLDRLTEQNMQTSPKPKISPTINKKIKDSFVSRCEQELVDLIGPIGTFLVQDIVNSHSQLHEAEILEVLAAEIPDSRVADEFRRRLMT